MAATSVIDEVGQASIYWEDLPVGTRYTTS